MTTHITPAALAQLFTDARTHTHWQERKVSEATLRELFDLLKMAPTSANCSPARFVFVQSPQAKARLKPSLAEGNVEKTMLAPVTVIVGMDLEFYEQLGKLFPHSPDARSWFAGNDAAIQATAFRNSSLQGAYLIMAARALGLDCGPMSGFDAAKVEAEFFPQGTIKANFLINLGYGEASKLHGRSPRFAFEEACQIL
ncbi:malonic semialdehyde reductase [Vogesella sp. LIG4]|uniref:malonic semialdehyde reductase n=1 Tax=Vogesella sp. LIG4 TaxID=1192162 RepID=UPI00081FFB55|nr:malonic semialdehyde reductase [Vogesella sp. LIG4]SCK21289.1 3-hydroxypropanoate dehydrogenase [Vogesella sp. LIG4]